ASSTQVNTKQRWRLMRPNYSMSAIRNGRPLPFPLLPCEVVLLVLEEDVEGGEAPVAAGDVLLQFHLLRFAEGGVGVDLLLQHAEAVADHHDLVEAVLDGHLLALERGVL